MEGIAADWIQWLAFLATGAVAGTLAGLLGVGGGLFIVPVLLFILPITGINTPHLMALAVATSLATIIVTSISSIRAHHKRGAVNWSVFSWLTPGILVGAWAGAFVADWMTGTQLTLFFGVAVVIIGLQMFFGTKTTPHDEPKHKLLYYLSGSFIGLISAMIGIGGGSLTVPLLYYWKTPMVKAVATSAACGLPIAIAGTLGFIVAGWNEPQLPDDTFGYVYWPAVLGIITTSILFAPVGAHFAHTVDAVKLKKFFAIFLILVGIKLLFGQL